MITIELGRESRSFELDTIDEQWLVEQIRNRRKEGDEPCVMVSVNEPGVNVIMQAGNCLPLRPGSGQANRVEMEVFDLWNEEVGKGGLNPGIIISFLKRLRGLLK